MKFVQNNIIPVCRRAGCGSNCRTPAGLLRFPDNPDDNGYEVNILIENETDGKSSEDDRFICCAQCLQPVTRVGDKISMQGVHRHTFANPHGVVFEIGCFREAMGCRYAGPPTSEFTWFSGYAWRIAVCRTCMLHLGWLFTATKMDSFYGLINDRLVYPDKS